MSFDPYDLATYATWAVVFLGVGGFLFRLLYTLNAIKERGIETQGTVLRKSTRGAGHTVFYYWEVTFQDVRGITRESEFSVPQSAWEEVEKGASIPILYLRDNPKKCHHPVYINDMWNKYAVQAAYLMLVILFVIGAYTYVQIQKSATGG